MKVVWRAKEVDAVRIKATWKFMYRAKGGEVKAFVRLTSFALHSPFVSTVTSDDKRRSRNHSLHLRKQQVKSDSLNITGNKRFLSLLITPIAKQHRAHYCIDPQTKLLPFFPLSPILLILKPA
jgi:hypothetical protein